MYKIQTAKTIEHPLVIAFPHWNCSSASWEYNTNLYVDDVNVFQPLNGNSTRERPFSPIGYSGSSVSGAESYWNNKVNEEASNYYNQYVRPYMVGTDFLSDSYISTYKILFRIFLEYLDYIKTRYYDISVGDDEVGDTWKRANIIASIPEFKTHCYRTKIIQGLNKNKLNIITSNQTPTIIRCYFKNQEENLMEVYINYDVRGEHKEIDPDTGKLIRTPIYDTGSITMPVYINV